jgi:hypothetical protein
VFLHLAEVLTLKRNTAGELPLEKELMTTLARPSVSFHLLPLAAAAPAKATPKANPNNANKRKREEQSSAAPPQPGKGQPRQKGR